MSSTQPLTPRQLAGRLNRLKRKGLTATGRQRLREAALAKRPWDRSTGPRTLAGKARSAANGKLRQTRELSVRELREQTADVRALIKEMGRSRRLLLNGPADTQPEAAVDTDGTVDVQAQSTADQC